MQQIGRELEPLLLIGSPIDSGRENKERARGFCTWHSFASCTKHNCTGVGISFTRSHIFADSWEQSTVVDFMNRFPVTFQTVTDRSLFGPNVPHGVNTLTRWLTNSGCVAQALSSLTHSSTVRQTIMSAMSQQLQSDLGVAAASSAFAKAGNPSG